MSAHELPDSLDWPQRTREWWQAWVESPLTAAWPDLRWEYLLDTALIHATVWGAGDMSKAGELRARVEKLGAVGDLPPAAGIPTAKVVTPLDDLANRRAKRSAGA